MIFLHIDSEHPKSLKDSILYNQALRIKRICAISKDFEHHCKECKQQFLEGYNSELLDKHIKAVEKLTRIPLVVTYNRFLPNIICKIIRKN